MERREMRREIGWRGCQVRENGEERDEERDRMETGEIGWRGEDIRGGDAGTEEDRGSLAQAKAGGREVKAASCSQKSRREFASIENSL